MVVVVDWWGQRQHAVAATVGDSPRGPLKQWGKTHLKPRAKPDNIKPNHAGA
jgi:hypothetical protein